MRALDRATSERMGRVRQKGTSAELAIRAAVSALGHRYRISNRDLPGAPDLANRRHRWAIFVHGCFWHRHPGCRRTTIPKHNAAFWLDKFRANVERDKRVIAQLEADGFRVLVVWECDSESEASRSRLVSAFFLQGDRQ